MPERTSKVSFKRGRVDFKGIRFTYDTTLASAVEAEIVPASTEGKPNDIWPEHPAFTLVGYPKSAGKAEDAPTIRIYSIAKFREVAHQASEAMAKVTNPPTGDWAPGIDAEVATLRTLLERRLSSKNLNLLIPATTDSRGERYSAQIPFLPWYDASQAFTGRLRYLDFKNGKGLFFLTQWDNERNLITNEGLEYAFQGITSDGQYYVCAEFAVAAPFLPEGDEPDVIAWSEKNYLLPSGSEKYQTYLRPVLAKLEALPANRFQPNLESIEKLIQSLSIQKQ